MEPQREAHRLHQDASHLKAQVDKLDEDDPIAVSLALSTAKKVRRTSNLVVRQLAAIRDQLQSQEGTSE